MKTILTKTQFWSSLSVDVSNLIPPWSWNPWMKHVLLKHMSYSGRYSRTTHPLCSILCLSWKIKQEHKTTLAVPCFKRKTKKTELHWLCISDGRGGSKPMKELPYIWGPLGGSISKGGKVQQMEVLYYHCQKVLYQGY